MFDIYISFFFDILKFYIKILICQKKNKYKYRHIYECDICKKNKKKIRSPAHFAFRLKYLGCATTT